MQAVVLVFTRKLFSNTVKMVIKICVSVCVCALSIACFLAFLFLSLTAHFKLVFDECHKAKNLMPNNTSKSTKTGAYVLELQQKLPKARVVYCSATGASEPRHMAYMSRLGIWGKGTDFRHFSDFLSAVEKRGVGGMEIVAMDMKLRGMYLARQLSFQGSSFGVVDVKLTPEFKKVYDDSVRLVRAWSGDLFVKRQACRLT